MSNVEMLGGARPTSPMPTRARREGEVPAPAPVPPEPAEVGLVRAVTGAFRRRRLPEGRRGGTLLLPQRRFPLRPRCPASARLQGLALESVTTSFPRTLSGGFPCLASFVPPGLFSLRPLGFGLLEPLPSIFFPCALKRLPLGPFGGDNLREFLGFQRQPFSPPRALLPTPPPLLRAVAP